MLAVVLCLLLASAFLEVSILLSFINPATELDVDDDETYGGVESVDGTEKNKPTTSIPTAMKSQTKAALLEHDSEQERTDVVAVASLTTTTTTPAGDDDRKAAKAPSQLWYALAEVATFLAFQVLVVSSAVRECAATCLGVATRLAAALPSFEVCALMLALPIVAYARQSATKVVSPTLMQHISALFDDVKIAPERARVDEIRAFEEEEVPGPSVVLSRPLRYALGVQHGRAPVAAEFAELSREAQLECRALGSYDADDAADHGIATVAAARAAPTPTLRRVKSRPSLALSSSASSSTARGPKLRRSASHNALAGRVRKPRQHRHPACARAGGLP